MPFQVGQRVGDYEILQMLGAGGMGHVYRVRNVISNRIEAMKVLLPDLAAEPDLAVRFISEIRTLAGFDHPNIALLHTAFQADNQLVMMMEYVEGFTLEDRGQQKNLPGGEVVQIISQTLSALSYAHARGVIHRDIKPANIMVTSHGIAKLMDFGIAKSKVDNNLTRPGTTMGSLYYMSPEQVRGATVDARSDLYSIGVVLYELLAGIRPFEGDTTFGILNQQLNVVPRPPIEVNPALPAGLNDIILTALAKDPADRIQTADAFRNALKMYALRPASQQSESEEEIAPSAFSPKAPMPSPAPASVASAHQASEPAYQPVPQTPVAFPPEQQKSGSKILWIVTGAIAAMVALAAVGLTVPKYMHAHAAPDTKPAATSEPVVVPAAAPEPAPAPLVDATTSPAANPTPPATAASVTAAPTTPAPSTASRPSTSAHPVTPVQAANPGTHDVHAAQSAAVPSPAVAPPPAGNSAELAQLQEQLVLLNARSSAARRGVQQIRSQQEQMGLGLRGDVESAESRLDAYLRAANNDLRSGNASAAARNIDKADAEVAILEKFLGH